MAARETLSQFRSTPGQARPVWPGIGGALGRRWIFIAGDAPVSLLPFQSSDLQRVHAPQRNPANNYLVLFCANAPSNLSQSQSL